MVSFTTFVTEAQFHPFQEKDDHRVMDIVKRAGGPDTAKTVRMGQMMANKITDTAKALRRFQASRHRGYDYLAMIFYRRYLDLGGAPLAGLQF